MKISRIIATVIFCLTAQPSVLDLVIAGAAAVPASAAAEAQKMVFLPPHKALYYCQLLH